MTYHADLPLDAWERRTEPEMHDLIVMAHWDLVCLVAGKMRQSMPENVEEDDLRQYGVLGLMRAIRHYDPTTGNQFSKYAVNSIRGVILDELRSLDWAPRSLRKRQRDMKRAERDLTTSLGRTPSSSEIAEALLWTVADVLATRRQVEASVPKSLDEIRGSFDRDLHDTTASTDPEPQDSLPEPSKSSALTEALSEYVTSLPDLDRSVVVMTYYLGLKVAEVAAVLGIKEPQVREKRDAFLAAIYDRIRDTLKEPS